VKIISHGQTAFFRFSLWWQKNKEKWEKAVWPCETSAKKGLASVAWPDPLGTGAYRLEIISTMLQGSGLVCISNLF